MTTTSLPVGEQQCMHSLTTKDIAIIASAVLVCKSTELLHTHTHTLADTRQ